MGYTGNRSVFPVRLLAPRLRSRRRVQVIHPQRPVTLRRRHLTDVIARIAARLEREPRRELLGHEHFTRRCNGLDTRGAAHVSAEIIHDALHRIARLEDWAEVSAEPQRERAR